MRTEPYPITERSHKPVRVRFRDRYIRHLCLERNRRGKAIPVSECLCNSCRSATDRLAGLPGAKTVRPMLPDCRPHRTGRGIRRHAAIFLARAK
ncbi:hypothetical protein C7U60_14735 [Mesorhizobium plurifarium]|nr:hypothetical protein C7U60_14735 [Mesorhizobium plurifarium]